MRQKQREQEQRFIIFQMNCFSHSHFDKYLSTFVLLGIKLLISGVTIKDVLLTRVLVIMFQLPGDSSMDLMVMIWWIKFGCLAGASVIISFIQKKYMWYNFTHMIKSSFCSSIFFMRYNFLSNLLKWNLVKVNCRWGPGVFSGQGPHRWWKD